MFTFTLTLDSSVPKLILDGRTDSNNDIQIQLFEYNVRTDFIPKNRPNGLTNGTEWPWHLEIQNRDILEGHNLNELLNKCEQEIHFNYITYELPSPIPVRMSCGNQNCIDYTLDIRNTGCSGNAQTYRINLSVEDAHGYIGLCKLRWSGANSNGTLGSDSQGFYAVFNNGNVTSNYNGNPFQPEELSFSNDDTIKFSLVKFHDGIVNGLRKEIEDGECPWAGVLLTESCCPIHANPPINLRIRDLAGNIIIDPSNNIGNTSDCVNPETYKVEVMGNLSSDILRWDINGDIRRGGASQIFHLLSPGTFPINLRISRGGCIFSSSITICGKQTNTGGETIPNSSDHQTDHNFDFCGIGKILMMIGLALFFTGLVFVLCPLFSGLTDPRANYGVGAGFIVGGIILFLLGFILWAIFCKPLLCDWKVLLWQILFIGGYVFIFASFCIACLPILLSPGIAMFIGGIIVYLWWEYSCKPTMCQRLIELMFMIQFGLFFASILEFIFGMVVSSCIRVNQSAQILALIWAFLPTAMSTMLWLLLDQNKCLNKK